MRPALKLGVAALGLCGGGCTLVSDTICLNTLRVKECIEDYRECKRDRNWAEDAWRQLRCANPQTSYSSDYEAGFRDGFTHYLYWGGNCEPPPMPPKEYRKLKYQTPQGYQTIEDWFVGGAADGFNVMPAVLPSGLELFAEHVVPILQRRNLMRTEYEGTTLREHYGLARPASRYARKEEPVLA